MTTPKCVMWDLSSCRTSSNKNRGKTREGDGRLGKRCGLGLACCLQHLHCSLPAQDHEREMTDTAVTHRTLHTQQPTYLAELIRNFAPTRPLRSSARHLLQQPRTNTVTASRAFAVAAPRIWNSLPSSC